MLAIIQARMGSRRMPGKVLLELAGKPALELMLERVSMSKEISKVVVATSSLAVDDAIVSLCKKLGYDVFRGSEEDVLSRYYECAMRHAEFSESIVRLTADCPFADPCVIDKTIKLYKKEGVQFCNNNFSPSYPDGLDVAVFSREALIKANESATLPSDREHVTAFIIRNSSLNNKEVFSSTCLLDKENNSDIRITLDTSNDYELLNTIAERLGHKVSYSEIIDFLRSNSELLKINGASSRNEGYLYSLKEDLDGKA